MTSWADSIEPSPAWQAILRLRETIVRFQEAHGGNEALARPAHLAEMAAARLQALDPDLAFPRLLQDLGSRVDALQQQLTGHFESVEGAAVVEPAAIDSAADAVAEMVGLLPPAGNDERVGLTDAYRRDLEGLRNHVEGLVNDLQGTVSAAAEQHATGVRERDARLAALTTRLDELDAAAAETRTQIDALIAERTQAFDAAINESRAAHEQARQAATAELSAVLEDNKAAFAAQVTEQEDKHAAQVEAHKTQASESLASIEALKEKAEKLVGAVGRTGLSGGFQQWEAAERKHADQMRLVAIIFGVLAALSIVGLLGARASISDEDNRFDVPLAISSLALPAALGGVATYAGRESARHRRNQVIARRTELELASFGPFIADLTAEQQAEVTALFTTVFFGQAIAHTAASGDEDAGPQAISKEVLGQLAAILQANRETPARPN